MNTREKRKKKVIEVVSNVKIVELRDELKLARNYPNGQNDSESSARI